MSKEVQNEATGAQVGKVAPDASGASALVEPANRLPSRMPGLPVSLSL